MVVFVLQIKQVCLFRMLFGAKWQECERFSTLNQFSADIQCFMVKPVLNLSSQFKDKELPEQILKYEFTHH